MSDHDVSKEVNQYEKDIIEKWDKQDESNQMYQKILESYGFATFDSEGQYVQGKALLESDDYPPYYGGAYIDQSGGLVIYFTGPRGQAKKQIDEIIGEKNYTLKQARFSYRDLMKTKEMVDNYFSDEDNADKLKNVCAYGIMDSLNMVNVGMLDICEENIVTFRKDVCDSEMLYFEEDSIHEAQATLRPGQRVVTTGNSTATCRARIGAINCFLMSGHSTSGVGQVVRNASGVTLGTVRNRQLVNNGNVDAALVTAAGGITLSNLIQQDGSQLGPSHGTAAVNTAVSFAGQTANFIRHGSVQRINQTIRLYQNNVFIARLVGLSLASYESFGGDSGGPVYRISGGARIILGNHIAAGPYFGPIAAILIATGASLF